MKSRLCWTACAVSIGALFAFSSGANATSVSIFSQDTTTLPTSAFVTPAVSSSSVGYIESTTQSIVDEQLSPWATTPGNQTTNPFSVLNSAAATQASPAFAIYNLTAGSNTFSFLWGSPDGYNTVEFFTALGGVGTPIATFTPGVTPPPATGSGFDFITFLASGGTIGSVELLDNTTAAFEYANVSTGGTMSDTPLPGALPSFVGGLLLIGMLCWRRKRNGLPVLAA